MDSHRLSKEAKEGKDGEEGRLFTDLEVCGTAVLFSALYVCVTMDSLVKACESEGVITETLI